MIPDDLYGGTYRLVDKVLSRWGLDVHDGRPDRPRRGRRRGAAGDEAGVGRDADEPDAEGGRHPGRDRARPAARSSRSTTRSPRPSTSGRWSSARTPSCTRRPSTWAGTRTAVVGRGRRARRGGARGGAVRAELDRRRARAAGLLPRAPRAAHAAPADGGAHRERARRSRRGSRASRASTTCAGRGSPGWSRSGTRTRSRIVVAHEGVLAGRVAGRRGVADRGPAGDDARVRRRAPRRPSRPISCGSRAASRRPRIWSRTSRRRSARIKSRPGNNRCDGRWVSLRLPRRDRRHPRLMLRIALAATTAGLAHARRRVPRARRGRRGDRSGARPRAAASSPMVATATPEAKVSLPPLPEASRAKSVAPVAGARGAAASDAAADPGLTAPGRQAHHRSFLRRARARTPRAAAPTPSTRRSRSATASRCRRWRRPRRSRR